MPAVPSRVAITGVTSFIGYHLARTFAERGAEVTAIHGRSREVYSGIQHERLARLAPHVAFIEADVRAKTQITDAIEQADPSLFIHHAGYATGYTSLDYDLSTAYAVNVEPLDTIYKALHGRNCPVIITGSSEEYSASSKANGEADACAPRSPYGLSKLMETLRASQLAARWQVPTRIGRLYIVFGPLDHPDKLLSQVPAKLALGQPVDLSPCTQARDFIGIEDCCAAWLKMAQDMPRTLFDVFNICSGQPTVLRDLLLGMAARLSVDPALLRFGKLAMRATDEPVSFGSNDKAVRLLGWKPARLEDAIEANLLRPAA